MSHGLVQLGLVPEVDSVASQLEVVDSVLKLPKLKVHFLLVTTVLQADLLETALEISLLLNQQLALIFCFS